MAQGRYEKIGEAGYAIDYVLGSYGTLHLRINHAVACVLNIFHQGVVKNGRHSIEDKSFSDTLTYKKKNYRFYAIVMDKIIYYVYEHNLNCGHFLVKHKNGTKKIENEVYHVSNCRKYKFISIAGNKKSEYVKDHFEPSQMCSHFIINNRGKILAKLDDFYPIVRGKKNHTNARFFWEKKWTRVKDGRIDCVYHRGKFYKIAQIDGSIYLQWSRELFKMYPEDVKKRIFVILLCAKLLNNFNRAKYGYIILPRPLVFKILLDSFRI